MLSIQAENIKRVLLQNKNLEQVLNTPLEKQRKNWEESASTDIIPDIIFTEKTVIRNISVEWVSMKNSSKQNIILYFHGGGFNQGSTITHRKLAAYIVKAAHVPILMHNYPLTPENPYPAALVSSEQIYSYLLENGYQPENIILGGDSSGGGLALALTLLLKDKKVPLPKGVFLLSPMVDFTLSGDTLKTNEEKDPLLFVEDLQITVNRYIAKESPFNPLISPIFGDLRGIPPMFIQVGSDELLLSDSTRLAELARASQTDVQLSVWEGMWHVFQVWVSEIPEASESIESIARFTQTITIR